jgi:DNA invertase Pin-like site-specific DNA recombinase
MTGTAYSYIRFSTPAQARGDSARRQMAKSERYAAEHGLILDTSLRDSGVSAFTGDNRRKGKLGSFLARIEAGDIAAGSFLIVENIDRLSRENPWDATGMFRSIIGAGVTVVSLIDDMQYDLAGLRSRPEMMTTLQAALTKGHRESRDKADRLQEVWAEKRSEIEAGGRKKLTRQGPGWLDLIADDPREPLIGDWRFNERADVVRLVFKLCADGLGKEAISRRLNDDAVPTFKGGDGWQASTVYLLLTDRRTIGELQLHRKVNKVRQPAGAPIKGYFPAVVSEADFYAAQDALSRRWTGASVSRKKKVPNILIGLGRCQCGRSMEFRDKQSSHKSSKAVYLICSGAQRRHACENKNHFTYADTESLILDWIADIKVSDDEADRATSAAVTLSAKNAERDDLKRRMAAGLEKWQAETDETLRDMLYASVKRYSGALPAIEAEIGDLETIVRTTKRSVIDDQRAAVRRLREQMAISDGDALFEMRARLAAALRQVIDHVEFRPDASFRVTLRGGLKLYSFEGGKFVQALDLQGINEGPDDVLRFPDAAMIDANKMHPLIVADIRKNLEEIAA